MRLDRYGRILYDKIIHNRHRETYTEEEKAFLCGNFHSMRKGTIGLILGRTTNAISHKYNKMLRLEQVNQYRRLWESLDKEVKESIVNGFIGKRKQSVERGISILRRSKQV